MSFYQKHKFLVWLFLLGLAARLLMLAVIDSNPAFNFLDSQGYDQIGWQIAQSWHGGSAFNVAQATSHIQIGYYYFVAGIYYLFGHHEIIVDIFNILFGIFAAVLLYFLTRELFSESAAKIAAALAMFWPSIMLWSTRNLKDAFLLFLMAAIALFFVKLVKKFRLAYLAGLVASAVFLLSMRSYTFFVFMGTLAGGYLIFNFKKLNRRAVLISLSIMVLMVGSVLFLLQFKDLQWNYLTKFNMQTVYEMRRYSLVGGSAFGVEYNSVGDIIKFFPIGLAYVVLAPFPWQSGSALFNIAVPETILWYFILPAVIYGAYFAIKKRKVESWALLCFMILMISIFAVLQGNLGSLFRQRAQIWFFGFVFGGIGIADFLNSKSSRLKRFFDIVASMAGLILLSPLFVVISLAIFFGDGRPIFYLSGRVGYGGKKFKMLKFRTMKVNRENIKEFEYTPEKDPRVTRAGKWLRRFSIDELPQLFNILKGEMSVVGPRPTFPFLMENASEFERRRLTVRPGLTGWQQVNGRNSLGWQKVVAFDNWYIDNRSFGLDSMIIWKTFSTIISGRGLYAPDDAFRAMSKSFKEFVEESEKNT